MITGVAFCPQAPALDPAVGRGLDAELGPVRRACRAAVARVATSGTSLVVVGGTPGHDVATWVMTDAVGHESWTAAAADDGLAGRLDGAHPVAVVVLGDGSARRSEQAPGHLDARSAGFDEGVTAALAGGDPARLAALDGDLGCDLLAAGVPAWHAVAAALGARRFTADVLYDDAPFGVGYVVAVWS
ncbi:hypothetical protein SAMN05443575_2558 [Jatrophihabitans endophyticus]|uniref:Catalytic LigB subunit of aromatic ring-opening dioxygenase n=1 Tax=Jatrophihabitans endophyticus TaxID=1206085 RepID=A0A1M5LXI3_9ACTN|nr:hypothetical protein [Jatrophihabitans endophyticus]SHG69103.1 hypothetical protein SAMN05443575_2558 [Jatrophihabitans endophyticus]